MLASSNPVFIKQGPEDLMCHTVQSDIHTIGDAICVLPSIAEKAVCLAEKAVC